MALGKTGGEDEEEQGWVAEHAAAKPPTFKAPHFEEAPTMVARQQVKEGSTEMPAAMGMLMLPMHEELSLRSSGECVSDFDVTVDDAAAAPDPGAAAFGSAGVGDGMPSSKKAKAASQSTALNTALSEGTMAQLTDRGIETAGKALEQVGGLV